MLWVATGAAAYLGVGGRAVRARRVRRVAARSPTCRTGSRSGSTRGRTPTTGFQIVQALFAVGAGGVAGTGLGSATRSASRRRTTDFIFAAIGEELGLLGTTAVLVCLPADGRRGLRIAVRAERPFEKLLAAGLTTILGVQTFIIIGGVTRVVPLTGVTLPFVSYGGSSLVANYVLLALLLRISDDSAESAGRRRRRRRDPGAAAG